MNDNEIEQLQLFENCLKYYFDYSILPHSFTFVENRDYLDESTDKDKINEIDSFIKVIKDILDKNKSKLEDSKEQIIKNDYHLFNIEIINGQKTMLFKFSDFMFYAYGCHKISFNFLNEANNYFQSEHFGLSKDIIEYSKHGKPNFKTKYQDKDIKICSIYPYILETDISNYYPSIYTHMFARCLDGKNPLQKPNNTVSNQKTLGYFIDSFIQKGQNNETNGVPIGSMLYRIFVEMLSIYIDNELIEKLQKNGIKEYEGCRVVDDRFIGFKKKEHAEVCLSELRQILHSMRLSVNDSKTKIIHIKEIANEPWKKDFNKISLKKDKYISQLDNDIFYHYNNIKNEKEKSKMFKYAVTTFGNKLNDIIKKYKNINDRNYYLLHKLFLTAPYYHTYLFKENVLEEITKNEKFGKLFTDTAIDIINSCNSYQNGEIIGCLTIIKFYLKSFPDYKKYFNDIVKNKLDNNKCPFVKAILNDINDKEYCIKDGLIKDKNIRCSLNILYLLPKSMFS